MYFIWIFLLPNFTLSGRDIVPEQPADGVMQVLGRLDGATPGPDGQLRWSDRGIGIQKGSLGGQRQTHGRATSKAGRP